MMPTVQGLDLSPAVEGAQIAHGRPVGKRASVPRATAAGAQRPTGMSYGRAVGARQKALRYTGIRTISRPDEMLPVRAADLFTLASDVVELADEVIRVYGVLFDRALHPVDDAAEG